MSVSCKLCGATMQFSSTAIVLGRHEGAYYFCRECGFLCVNEPYWLDEAYSSAIASSDTGLVTRNVNVASRIAALLYFYLSERGKGRYLDIAGGYGLLTRLMRDYGFDFYWTDKYCQNLMARGFEYTSEMGRCRAIIAIEVFEHLDDPVKFINDALDFGQSDTLIFSTELFEGNQPPPEDWWYYSFETGQHVSFFQRVTLGILACKLGMHYATNGWLHIFSRTRINQFLFSFYTSRLAVIMAHFVRKRLVSLLMSDNKIILENYKNHV